MMKNDTAASVKGCSRGWG